MVWVCKGVFWLFTIMEDISPEEKVRIASEYLLNAPPGEFNDVFNDIRVLINNDSLLQRGVANAFQEYNTEQFTPVDVPNTNHKVVICKAGQVDSSHYIDPRSNQTFIFDHMRQVASEPQPSGMPNDSTRAALEEAFLNYLADHYATGVVSVFKSDNTYTVALVGNKYNPRNYWNGRWRSMYTISGNSVKGLLRTQVHYYEDGNVQLQSEKSIEFNAPASNPAEIIKQVKKAESDYQTALNESYAQLSDTTFKALRRALPITRNKLDWNKILTYKIGNELSQK